nr:hypothetical protein BgiMline_014316 [Biomphalaria glabrata]
MPVCLETLASRQHNACYTLLPLASQLPVFSPPCLPLGAESCGCFYIGHLAFKTVTINQFLLAIPKSVVRAETTYCLVEHLSIALLNISVLPCSTSQYCLVQHLRTQHVSIALINISEHSMSVLPC